MKIEKEKRKKFVKKKKKKKKKKRQKGSRPENSKKASRFYVFFNQIKCLRVPLVAECTRCNIDKVCQCIASDRWFTLGTSVSSTNEIDSPQITDILLTVA